MRLVIRSLAAMLVLSVAAFAQERPTAFINARLIPIVGQPIENGILLVQNGKIVAVGDARTVRLSSDVVTVDLAGKVIMPGLVDTHSHIGGGSGGDASGPIQPDVRLLDSLNPRAASLQRAQSGGITMPAAHASKCSRVVSPNGNTSVTFGLPYVSVRVLSIATALICPMASMYLPPLTSAPFEEALPIAA